MNDAEREERDNHNREAWQDARLSKLRAALESLRGRTAIFDLSDAIRQDDRLLVRIEQVHAEVAVVTNLSDASIAPSARPLVRTEPRSSNSRNRLRDVADSQAMVEVFELPMRLLRGEVVEVTDDAGRTWRAAVSSRGGGGREVWSRRR